MLRGGLVDFNQFKDMILTSALTGMVAYLAIQVKALVDSMTELNIKMATIVAHIANHTDTLERHEEQIQKLEDRLQK